MLLKLVMSKAQVPVIKLPHTLATAFVRLRDYIYIYKTH